MKAYFRIMTNIKKPKRVLSLSVSGLPQREIKSKLL